MRRLLSSFFALFVLPAASCASLSSAPVDQTCPRLIRCPAHSAIADESEALRQARSSCLATAVPETDVCGSGRNELIQRVKTESARETNPNILEFYDSALKIIETTKYTTRGRIKLEMKTETARWEDKWVFDACVRSWEGESANQHSCPFKKVIRSKLDELLTELTDAHQQMLVSKAAQALIEAAEGVAP